MKEIRGNLFNQVADAIAITTNGYVKSDGTCVVGKGCAKAAQNKWRNFSLELGRNISTLGNVPSVILEKNENRPYSVLSFPVKPRVFTVNNDKSNVVSHMQKQVSPGRTFFGWASKADPAIIMESAYKLIELTDVCGYEKVVIPRPGCGAGELTWEHIGPRLHRILDDRFYSITF